MTVETMVTTGSAAALLIALLFIMKNVYSCVGTYITAIFRASCLVVIPISQSTTPYSHYGKKYTPRPRFNM